MTREIQLRVLPAVAASENAIKRYIAEDQGIDLRTIYSVRVLKKSIDARQRTIYVNLKVRSTLTRCHKTMPTSIPNIRM